MISNQFILPLQRELIVDLFAGGGGASCGIEQALGRHVDIAVNHDPDAVSLHEANHPQTRHFISDVFEVDPAAVCDGRPVGLLWASPDCKHFSKAKGGKPVSKRIRGLAWVVVKWAKIARPRIIHLENVEEFQTWGPLLPNGRVCQDRKGRTFRTWKRALERLGYAVEHRELRACDYGAPTIRKRLFLVARRDGLPIRWPQATHGAGLKPYRTAAEIIDWSLPCPSIFERERPLAEATLRRIAHGIKRYVIDAKRPFIVNQELCHADPHHAAGQHHPAHPVPARGQSGAGAQGTRGARAGDIRSIGASGHPGSAGDQGGRGAQGARSTLIAAFLAKHYGGVVGTPLAGAIGTVTSIDHHSLVTSHLAKLRGTSHSASTAEPLATVSAGGTHHAEVRALLVKYYGSQQAPDLREPLHTVTTKDRFGLVTVAGQHYAIADIGLRMLQPRELYRAQGFPDSYIIDRGADGRALSKSAQVRMCGNSVCPPLARALVAANYAKAEAMREAA